MTTITGKGKKDPATAKKESKTNNRQVFKYAQLRGFIKEVVKYRISKAAIILLDAAGRYILGEILDSSKTVCDEEGKRKISVRHLSTAIYKDKELRILGIHWLIKEGGICTSVHDIKSRTKSSNKIKKAEL